MDRFSGYHFKSDEIHLAGRDPDVTANPDDKPAGAYSRIQRRKWKLWVNYALGKIFFRTSLLENGWTELPTSKPVAALPAPKLRQPGMDPATNRAWTDIEWYDRGSLAAGGTFRLYGFPEVVAEDLTDAQLAAGVVLEMAYYRKRKSSSISSGKGRKGGWVVPSSMVGGANPYAGRWSRGGIHKTAGGGTISASRPNHLTVSTHNQVIPAYQCLNNRFTQEPIQYRDTTGTNQTLTVLTLSSRLGTRSRFPSGWHYSNRLTPMYVKFRYAVWDASTQKWASGPWSEVLHLAPMHHPFNYDGVASATVGRPCCTINPLFDVDVMMCSVESKV